MTSDLGTVETVGDTYVLRYERRFAHPVRRVWAALTDPAEMVAWWADADVDLTLGGKVELRWLNSRDDTPATVARGTVSALEPPHLVEYDTDVHGVLRWELRETADGCALTFICTVALPDEFVLKNLAGWHIHLDHLAGALDGRPVDWPQWWTEHYPAWEQHHARYADAVPGAAT
jgi:uncharacterized protein YndB with AHSA1/START domain